MASVPIAGNVPKPVLITAVIAGAGALGYAWYRDKKKKGAAAAAPPDTTGTSAADSYGYGAYADEGAYAYGAYTYSGEPYGYGGFNAGLPSPPVTPVAGTPETNAQWAQSVVNGLTSGGAYDQHAVLDALGAYETGAQVTADQERIIRAAIAADGYPPVPGANGYPPAIRSSPPAGQVSSGQATVPNVTGGNLGHAYNVLTSAGLVPGYRGGTPSSWIVTAQSVKAGTVVNKGSLVKLTVPRPK